MYTTDRKCLILKRQSSSSMTIQLSLLTHDKLCFLLLLIVLTTNVMMMTIDNNDIDQNIPEHRERCIIRPS